MAGDITLLWTVTGTGAGDVPFEVSGTLLSLPGDFQLAMTRAFREAFQQLTQGRAVFGHPGKGGCTGPYKIRKFTIEEVSPQ